jgi:hypothetical protein
MSSKKKDKKKNKKVKTKEILRVQVAQMFHDAGYDVDADAFSDGSSSWLNIAKNGNSVFSLVLSFNGEGTKFEDFNVWKEITEVVSEEKIF